MIYKTKTETNNEWRKILYLDIETLYIYIEVYYLYTYIRFFSSFLCSVPKMMGTFPSHFFFTHILFLCFCRYLLMCVYLFVISFFFVSSFTVQKHFPQKVDSYVKQLLTGNDDFLFCRNMMYYLCRCCHLFYVRSIIL